MDALQDIGYLNAGPCLPFRSPMRTRLCPFMTRVLLATAPLTVGCAGVPFDTEGTGGSLLSYTYRREESVSVFTDLYVDANTSWEPKVPVASGFPASFAATVSSDGPTWTPHGLNVLTPSRRVQVADRGSFTRVDARVPTKGKARLDLGKVKMPIRVRTPARWVLVQALAGPSEIVGDFHISASAPALDQHVRVLSGNQATFGLAVRDAKNRPLGWAGRCAFSSSNANFPLTSQERCAVTVKAPEAGTTDVGVGVTWLPYAFGPDAPTLAPVDLHTSAAPWQVTAVPSSGVSDLVATQLVRDSGGIFQILAPPPAASQPATPPVAPTTVEGAFYRVHALTPEGAPVEVSDVAWTATGARVFEWAGTFEVFMTAEAVAKEMEKQLPEGAAKPDSGDIFQQRLAARFPDPRRATGGNVVIVLLDTPGQPATLTYTAAGRTGTVTVK